MMTPEQWKTFDSWPKGLCIDPHDAKSFFLGWFAVNPRDEIIFFEEFPTEDFYETRYQLGAKGYAEAIRAIELGDNQLHHPITNVVWRLLDPNFGPSTAAETGQSLQEAFAEQGLWFDCNIDDRLPVRHVAVHGRLDEGKLMFTPNCRNLIESMERYIFRRGRTDSQERVSEKVEEAYKDGADVVGYTCVSKIQYFRPGDDMPPTAWIPNGGLGRPPR